MTRIAQKMTAGLRLLAGITATVALGAALFAGASGAAAAGDFEVRDAWAQPTAGAVDVYFTLINKGGMGFLVGVEADGGLAQFCTEMGSVTTGVASDCGKIDRMMLAGDDSFVFDRRDVYVQLSKLDQTPEVGDTIIVRLLFADGTKVPITAALADRET